MYKEQKIKFGTDGWRAIIAQEFTVGNVARVSTGVAEYLKTEKKFYRPQDIRVNLSDPNKAFKILGWKAESDMYSVVKKLIDIELNKY